MCLVNSLTNETKQNSETILFGQNKSEKDVKIFRLHKLFTLPTDAWLSDSVKCLSTSLLPPAAASCCPWCHNVGPCLSPHISPLHCITDHPPPLLSEAVSHSCWFPGLSSAAHVDSPVTQGYDQGSEVLLALVLTELTVTIYTKETSQASNSRQCHDTNWWIQVLFNWEIVAFCVEKNFCWILVRVSSINSRSNRPVQAVVTKSALCQPFSQLLLFPT